MKKKSFDFESDTTKNEQAVTAALKRKRKPDPETWPTRTQLQKPLPGQQSIFDQEPAPATVPNHNTALPAVIRRKSDERRTKMRQLIITPTARENLRKRAENEDISINDCLNLLTAAAIRDGMKVKREKAAEPKTKRQIFAVTPTFEKEIKATATAQGVSLNEYICFVLENHEKVKL